jgi:hypothetical protein
MASGRRQGQQISDPVLEDGRVFLFDNILPLFPRELEGKDNCTQFTFNFTHIIKAIIYQHHIKRPRGKICPARNNRERPVCADILTLLSSSQSH